MDLKIKLVPAIEELASTGMGRKAVTAFCRSKLGPEGNAVKIGHKWYVPADIHERLLKGEEAPEKIDVDAQVRARCKVAG